MAVEVEYRNAARKDLTGIADVFLAAFPESVEHYVGHPIKPDVIEDGFAIALDAEPESLFVAMLDDAVTGYVLAPTQFSRIVRTAIFHGHLLRMFRRWITGRYGIGIKPVLISARNWLSLWREAREPEMHAEGRILSIAVSPRCQGMGVGTKLMELGLSYLRSRGERVVRLEVRPENAAAVHVYEKLGFECKGHTHDTQGQWLIMLCELPEENRE